MFAKRLLSSIILWTVLLTTFKLGLLASVVLYCVIAVLATREFYVMLEKKGERCCLEWGMLGSAVYSAGIWWYQIHARDQSCHFESLFLIAMVLGLFLIQLFQKDHSESIRRIGNTMMGIFYVPWLFGFIPKIEYIFDLQNSDLKGWHFILFLVITTKFCDTGAYAVGRVLGRHKMAPGISPKKTWEGLVGGLSISMVAGYFCFDYLKERIEPLGFHFKDALILSFLLGAMGVAGDLCESILKRETNVKDSGEVLPGIGGALDLIDSLLFTAPVLYAYLVIFILP